MKTSEFKESRLPVFTERFQSLRNEGETQVAFAARLDIARPTVAQYENGSRIPDAEMITKICSICRISSDWLLGISDIKIPDATIQEVCEYTGLSQAAVELLHKETIDYVGFSPITDFLNKLMSERFFIEELSMSFRQWYDYLLELETINEFDLSDEQVRDIIEQRAKAMLNVQKAYNGFGKVLDGTRLLHYLEDEIELGLSTFLANIRNNSKYYNKENYPIALDKQLRLQKAILTKAYELEEEFERKHRDKEGIINVEHHKADE